jgi:hypothetical protein
MKESKIEVETPIAGVVSSSDRKAQNPLFVARETVAGWGRDLLVVKQLTATGHLSRFNPQGS